MANLKNSAKTGKSERGARLRLRNENKEQALRDKERALRKKEQALRDKERALRNNQVVNDEPARGAVSESADIELPDVSDWEDVVSHDGDAPQSPPLSRGALNPPQTPKSGKYISTKTSTGTALEDEEIFDLEKWSRAYIELVDGSADGRRAIRSMPDKELKKAVKDKLRDGRNDVRVEVSMHEVDWDNPASISKSLRHVKHFTESSLAMFTKDLTDKLASLNINSKEYKKLKSSILNCEGFPNTMKSDIEKEHRGRVEDERIEMEYANDFVYEAKGESRRGRSPAPGPDHEAAPGLDHEAAAASEDTARGRSRSRSLDPRPRTRSNSVESIL